MALALFAFHTKHHLARCIGSVLDLDLSRPTPSSRLAFLVSSFTRKTLWTCCKPSSETGGRQYPHGWCYYGMGHVFATFVSAHHARPARCAPGVMFMKFPITTPPAGRIVLVEDVAARKEPCGRWICHVRCSGSGGLVGGWVCARGRGRGKGTMALVMWAV